MLGSQIELTNLTSLQAGAPYKIKPQITTEWTEITTVEAALVSHNDPAKDMVIITTPLELDEFDVAEKIYKGILNATETAKFLTDPEDLTSALKYKEVYLRLKITGLDADSDSLVISLYSDNPIKVDRLAF